jgi:hypothetical protein
MEVNISGNGTEVLVRFSNREVFVTYRLTVEEARELHKQLGWRLAPSGGVLQPGKEYPPVVLHNHR